MLPDSSSNYPLNIPDSKCATVLACIVNFLQSVRSFHPYLFSYTTMYVYNTVFQLIQCILN